MLFRNDPVDVIRKGDLNKLRKMLGKKRGLLDEWFEWESGDGNYSGNILHAAAFFNQTEIIKFLVNEKSMDVNQPNKYTQRTPLHYACEYGGFESASLLFSQLGANPALRCNSGGNGYAKGTAYELSKDERIKALLLPSHEAQMQQEETERLKQKRAEAETRIVGTWEINPSTSEIVHKHELPGGEFRVTDAFNFAAGRLLSIVYEPNSRNVSHKETFFKPEEISGNPALSEAFAKLQELTGKTASSTGVKLKLLPANKGP